MITWLTEMYEKKILMSQKKNIYIKKSMFYRKRKAEKF